MLSGDIDLELRLGRPLPPRLDALLVGSAPLAREGPFARDFLFSGGGAGGGGRPVHWKPPLVQREHESLASHSSEHRLRRPRQVRHPSLERVDCARSWVVVGTVSAMRGA